MNILITNMIRNNIKKILNSFNKLIQLAILINILLILKQRTIEIFQILNLKNAH
jgi:hypothetical protein